MKPGPDQQLEGALASQIQIVRDEAEISRSDREQSVAFARQALGAGLGGKAIPLLAALNRKFPADTEIVTLHGVALRLEQRLVEAAEVFAAARFTGLDDPAVLQGLAQTRFELGLPAANLFGEIRRASPDNLEIQRNHTAAMAAEGDRAGAMRLLLDTLRANPGWLDGHKTLATLRWTGGDRENFAASYADAARIETGNVGLWLAWFGAVAQTHDWEQARAILAEAESHLGATTAILSARLFLACEGGDPVQAAALLAKTAHITGDTINLCRIRHSLRQGRPEPAHDLILPLLDGASAGLFWPYASLIWRLLGDPRAEWLDKPGMTIQSRTINLDGAEMAELGDVLRALHTMERPYAEQTVRGGTQTDRSVMLRHEPILQRARVAWMEAVTENIAELPGAEDGHPFLRQARSQLLLGGSWSVKLRAAGHNVPHTHPMGWMSSSLYVAIPDEAIRGPAPAGHISFGTPPPELGLDLAPYSSIAPEPGMVVTFPSTMWHAVEPFAAGERLMIALDIRAPQF
jgi:hypothetical protein